MYEMGLQCFAMCALLLSEEEKRAHKFAYRKDVPEAAKNRS